jgi:predicted ATPase
MTIAKAVAPRDADSTGSSGGMPLTLRSMKCPTQRVAGPSKLVVLTGGPGAGKTAVLELARRDFCERIAVLPEAASIVFGGGFPRRESFPARKAAQRAIFRVQWELERLLIEEEKSAVILCDRGTLDGLAYWPNSEDSFWEENGTTRATELARYAAIIHLRTPGAVLGYNHQNPVRIETAAQASVIDQKIVEAWAGHPNRHFVESTEDFVSKAAQAIQLIRRELPECCQAHPV